MITALFDSQRRFAEAESKRGNQVNQVKQVEHGKPEKQERRIKPDVVEGKLKSRLDGKTSEKPNLKQSKDKPQFKGDVGQ